MDDRALVKVAGGEVPARLRALMEDAVSAVASSRAPSTLRAYERDWRAFEAWSAAAGLEPLPAAPATVALYLVHLAREGRKSSTISRAAAAIAYAHERLEFTSPTKHVRVKETLAGLRRQLGTRQAQKAAAVVEDVRAMVATLPPTLRGLRDRALLLVGFAGAFRRSELVGLDVEDLDFCPEGVVVLLRRSKTDQEGAGVEKGITRGQDPATCPVRALRAWLDDAGIESGPVFRAVNRYDHVAEGRLSDRAVALVVKRAAEAAGLDAARYSGHSLRAGLVTTAAKRGRASHDIRRQTGHTSDEMLSRYIRRASLFEGNVTDGIGL